MSLGLRIGEYHGEFQESGKGMKFSLEPSMHGVYSAFNSRCSGGTSLRDEGVLTMIKLSNISSDKNFLITGEGVKHLSQQFLRDSVSVFSRFPKIHCTLIQVRG